jgi:hypothetical protein
LEETIHPHPLNFEPPLIDFATGETNGFRRHWEKLTYAFNLGAGTNEDQIFVGRFSDFVLWESGIRARVLPETNAANLTVLLQIYSYVAFSAARYPAAVITLSGLTPPTF